MFTQTGPAKDVGIAQRQSKHERRHVAALRAPVNARRTPEPDTRSIWYVLANPGSDWWTTSDDAEGCLLGGSCAFSEDRVRQAPKACPHWACGAACPQRQDQCPPEEFEELGRRGKELGFLSVASGPFVRSSYNAAEVYAAVGAASGAGSP